MRRTPALIVGGGPAGAAAAIALARGGIDALVLERAHDTGDALCGGFLSWRTLDALAALGVAADELDPAPVTRLRLFAGGRRAEAMLPRPARGVSRRRLDTLLLARVPAVERGVMVSRLADGRAVADGSAIDAAALLIATGKHDLRGLGRVHDTPDPALGLRVRLPPSRALDSLVGDAIELHLFDRGYAGLVRQEDGANLCLAVRRSRLRAAGDPAALLAELGRASPPLGERLAHWPGGAIDAVANVPYGWRATAADGCYRLGDQAGVIPSLAGEGIGIALASGTSAAAALLAGVPPARWQPAFARRLRRPLALGGLVWRLAERPGLAALATLLPPPALRALARGTRVA